MQANTGVFTGYGRDATVRSVGVGWRELAASIEAVRLRTGAVCVLAPDYGTTWLSFYLPKGSCVVQPTQRIRWVNMPEPSAAQLSGKLLFVDEARSGARSWQTENFSGVERVAELTRMRGPLVVETYGIDLLEGAKGSAPTAPRRRNCSRGRAKSSTRPSTYSVVLRESGGTQYSSGAGDRTGRHGVLGRPVEPGDDSGGRSRQIISRTCRIGLHPNVLCSCPPM